MAATLPGDRHRGSYSVDALRRCEAGLLVALRGDRVGRGGFEPTRLIVNGDRDVAQLLRVFPSVVGAEEQLPTACQGYSDIGLRAAAVTTVRSRQGRARGECCSHLRPHLI